MASSDLAALPSLSNTLTRIVGWRLRQRILPLPIMHMMSSYYKWRIKKAKNKEKLSCNQFFNNVKNIIAKKNTIYKKNCSVKFQYDAIIYKIFTLYYVFQRLLQLFFQFENFRFEIGFLFTYISFIVETYKEGVGKIKTYTKTRILTERNVWEIENDISVDNRCMGINNGTSPKNTDDTNDARKVHWKLLIVCLHFAFIIVSISD